MLSGLNAKLTGETIQVGFSSPRHSYAEQWCFDYEDLDLWEWGPT